MNLTKFEFTTMIILILVLIIGVLLNIFIYMKLRAKNQNRKNDLCDHEECDSESDCFINSSIPSSNSNLSNKNVKDEETLSKDLKFLNDNNEKEVVKPREVEKKNVEEVSLKSKRNKVIKDTIVEDISKTEEKSTKSSGRKPITIESKSKVGKNSKVSVVKKKNNKLKFKAK
ncbi:MAG: hypothetical protein ACRC5M_02915 [Anaeroplasmataceae bacterium]